MKNYNIGWQTNDSHESSKLYFLEGAQKNDLWLVEDHNRVDASTGTARKVKIRRICLLVVTLMKVDLPISSAPKIPQNCVSITTSLNRELVSTTILIFFRNVIWVTGSACFKNILLIFEEASQSSKSLTVLMMSKNSSLL